MPRPRRAHRVPDLRRGADHRGSRHRRHGALQREAVDVASYWWFALPICYLAAGLLGYLGPVRTWRWSLDMLATHAVCMLLLAGSGLNLWPLALAFALALALPGILTAWLGGLVHRCRVAPDPRQSRP